MDLTQNDQINMASGSGDIKNYSNLKKSNGIELMRKGNNYSHSRHQNTLYQISKISSAKNDNNNMNQYNSSSLIPGKSGIRDFH